MIHKQLKSIVFNKGTLSDFYVLQSTKHLMSSYIYTVKANTVSYAQKTKTKNPRVFIFGNFLNEITEKKALFSEFSDSKSFRKYSWVFGFSFRCVRNGLSPFIRFLYISIYTISQFLYLSIYTISQSPFIRFLNLSIYIVFSLTWRMVNVCLK